MKKLILIAAAMIVLGTTSVNAQNRRVLIEEFTSSTCGPCAATDPIMEEFEAKNEDRITVLKWHVNWPSPGNDPFYTNYPKSRGRSITYYGNSSAPSVFFNGEDATNPGAGLQTLQTKLETALEGQVPYELSVKQTIEGDSVVATVTVKGVVGDIVAADPHLLVAFAERVAVYTGTNGRPYHTNAVRTVKPDLDDSGVPTAESLIAVQLGETKVYRVAAEIPASWNRSQLISVAFIQDAGSRQVYQSGWTILPLEVTAGASKGTVTGDANRIGSYTFKNTRTTPIVLNLDLALVNVPTNYSVSLGGVATDNTLALAPGESKTVTISSTGTGDQKKVGSYLLSYSGPEGTAGGAAMSLVWGKDATAAYVTAGAENYNGTYQSVDKTITSLNKGGLVGAKVDRATFSEAFRDWGHLKSVLYFAGYGAGVFTDTGDTLRVRSLLQGGGNFMLSSDRMAHIYANAGLSEYVSEVFNFEAGETDQTVWEEAKGVDGSIFAGISEISVANNAGVFALVPIEGQSSAALTDENDNIIAIQSRPFGGKMVYLTFEIGNISTTSKRDLVSKAIATWFNGTASGVSSPMQATFGLGQNYPNPFTPTTAIDFNLPTASAVTLTVHDVMGREVARLIDGTTYSEGPHSVTFNASELPSGTYSYTLSAGGERITRQMTLTK